MTTVKTIFTATAMLSDKKNTRLALATALVERNAECEALRLEVSKLRGAGPAARPAPKTIARSEFSAKLDQHMASMKERVKLYMQANPTARSVTVAELEEFEYYAG